MQIESSKHPGAGLANELAGGGIRRFPAVAATAGVRDGVPAHTVAQLSNNLIRV
jgi:hypothetical protein